MPPWTPRGVAQAWRVAAPPQEINPFQWTPHTQAEDEGEGGNVFPAPAGEESDFDSVLEWEGSEWVGGGLVCTPTTPSYKLALAQNAAGMSVYSVGMHARTHAHTHTRNTMQRECQCIQWV